LDAPDDFRKNCFGPLHLLPRGLTPKREADESIGILSFHAYGAQDVGGFE